MDIRLIKTILMLIVFSFVFLMVLVGFIYTFVKQIKQIKQNRKLKKSSAKFFSEKIEVDINEYEEFLEFKKFKNLQQKK